MKPRVFDLAATWLLVGVAVSVDAVLAQPPVPPREANHSPVLKDIPLSLVPVGQLAQAPRGPVGTRVSNLVGLEGAGGVENVSDEDENSRTGVAVTATDSRNGTWYVTTDNGITWNLLGSVSDRSARLFAADANTRLYFQPTGIYSGRIDTAITFRAWDQTVGLNGESRVNPIDGRQSHAFSRQTGTASMEVIPVESDNIGSLDSSQLAARTSDFGFRSGPRASTPFMLGDFGGGTRTVTLTITDSFHATGTVVSGNPGSVDAVVSFQNSAATSQTVAPGVDATGDTFADTFSVTPPVDSNGSVVTPGPSFGFDGGTAVLTNSTKLTTAQDGQFQSDDVWFATHIFSEVIEIPDSGTAVRRVKIAENNNPIPRDRFYFDYRFFRDVLGAVGDMNRFIFGAERTFLDGQSSIDVRLPFAGTLDNEQFDNALGARSVVFGNVTLISKHVISYTDTCIIAGGLGLTIPTGEDTRLFRTDGSQVLEVKTESVHLLPYIAALCTPNDRYYVQGFLEFDFDVNGNTVLGSASGGPIPEIGVLQDSSLLLLDISGGYWLYQSSAPDQALRRVAAIGELHFNTSLQDADVVAANGLTVTDLTRRFDVFNLTVGLHAQIHHNLNVMTGMTFPLRNLHDRQFDNELAVAINFFY